MKTALALVIDRVAKKHFIDIAEAEADMDDTIEEGVFGDEVVNYDTTTEKCVGIHLTAVLCSYIKDMYPDTEEGYNMFIEKMDIVRCMDEEEYNTCWKTAIPWCTIEQAVEELLVYYREDVYCGEDTIYIACVDDGHCGAIE